MGDEISHDGQPNDIGGVKPVPQMGEGWRGLGLTEWAACHKLFFVVFAATDRPVEAEFGAGGSLLRR